RILGHKVKSGYYSQYRIEMLQAGRTVLEEALDTPQPVTEQSVRTVLGSFLFRGDDVFKAVRVLSGGEKSRLALVKLLLDPPNLLLMDEPTTHLDLASVDALLEALRQFQGTLVIISHDVYFIRHLANHVVEVRDGRLRHFPGGYDYYLEKTRAEQHAVEARAGVPDTSDAGPRAGGKAAGREERRRRAEEVQARSRARRELQARVTELETQIAELEQRQTELTAILEDPATYAEKGAAIEANRELLDLTEALPRLTSEWEEAATALNALADQGVGS
ncbi:MAG: ABC-F family ATP-binding cassette domain-containing protein, partial [Verrucomicrobiae bacterium]|nr:ABC-F family ATP-binding cassette domain-containing protein [Verrucomicrobiae bacterium]